MTYETPAQEARAIAERLGLRARQDNAQPRLFELELQGSPLFELEASRCADGSWTWRSRPVVDFHALTLELRRG